MDDCDPGVGTHAAHQTVREHLTHLDEDRPIHRDIESVMTLLRSDQILENVETALEGTLA